MTTQLNLEQQLTAWLDSAAPPRAPESVLNGALSRTSRMRPRPAWAFIERWLPMQLTMRRRTFPRTLTYIALVLALALLLALSAFLVVGSLHRLAPTSGLAKPGLIAYDSGGHIFARTVDGSAVTQISTGNSFDVSPTWSADGSALLYWSSPNAVADDGSAVASLMYSHMDGTDPVTLASGVPVWIYGSPPALSPDGKFVAVVRQGDVASSVSVIAVPSGETVNTIPDADQPAWSPDSSQLAYNVRNADGVRNADVSRGIWVANLDGSNAHAVSEGLTTVGSGSGIPWQDPTSLGLPAWSPMGNELAFTAGNFTTQLYLVDADGTNLRQLDTGPGGADSPAWSPTGTRIAYVWKVDPTNPSSDLNIGFINADGTNSVHLTHPAVGYTVNWAPDESRILGYESNPGESDSKMIAVDPNQALPPVEMPLGNSVGFVSWQRLAN